MISGITNSLCVCVYVFEASESEKIEIFSSSSVYYICHFVQSFSVRWWEYNTNTLSIVICIKAETIVGNFDDVYVIYKSTATVCARISTEKNESRKDENKIGWSTQKNECYIPLLLYEWLTLYCIASSNISFEREY